jgi:hypothetical protein
MARLTDFHRQHVASPLVLVRPGGYPHRCLRRATSPTARAPRRRVWPAAAPPL